MGIKIKKLKEEQGASRFGSCNICDIGTDKSDDLVRITFDDASIVLCPEHLQNLREIVNSFESKKENFETAMTDGFTECCGYDFGEEAFGKIKPKYCPMCSRKITKVN